MTNAAKTAPARRGLGRFDRGAELEKSDTKHLLRLWPYVRPHWAPFVGAIVLQVVVSALALARPLVIRGGLDGIGREPSAITKAGVLLVALIVAEQTVAFPQVYLIQRVGARSMASLRRAIFLFLHSRNLQFFDRTPIGRLVTHVTTDVRAVEELFAAGAFNAFGDVLRLVVIVILMTSLDWRLSLIAFASVPFVMLAVDVARRRIRTAFRDVRAQNAHLDGFLNEQINGMLVVQAFAQEEAGSRAFDTINVQFRHASNRYQGWDAMKTAAIELVSSLCIASVLWAVGVTDHGRRVSFGTLFAFIAYAEMFFAPIRDLAARYSLLQSAMVGAERIFDLLDNDQADAPPSRTGAPELLAPTGPALSLENVTFGYRPEVPVLRGVSLAVARGERVALVGATGAGKSTVASLFVRLYDVDAGRAAVYGRDVRAWDPRELRDRFAVVPQDVFLFPGTVASNIAVGESKPDLARVRRALERIDAFELFAEREGGLDAFVAPGGSNFSAGQRQLIAFARALYRDPEVLLLDEATANVDSTTETRLQRAVEHAIEGRTALVIAHRLSTVRAADRIIVFHKGRVAEEGTHTQLLERQGLYARLHALHFGATPDVAQEPTVTQTGPMQVVDSSVSVFGLEDEGWLVVPSLTRID